MRRPFWILLAIVGLPILGAIVYEQVRLQTDPAYAAKHTQQILERAALVEENAAQEKLKQASIARSKQTEKWNSEHGKWDAALMSQNFVKDRLKAPSTAQFQDFSEAAVSHIGEGLYTVSSYVDSQNSFGAMLRMRYRCTLKDNGNDRWHLVDLKMDAR